MTRQQSFLMGELVTSCVNDANASLMKPGSHCSEADHFRTSDGLGSGIIDRI